MYNRINSIIFYYFFKNKGEAITFFKKDDVSGKTSFNPQFKFNYI